MDYVRKLVALAGPSIPVEEALLCLRMLDQVLSADVAATAALDVLQLVKAEGRSASFKSFSLYLNRCARELAQTESAPNRAAVVRRLLYLREMLDAIRSRDGESKPTAEVLVQDQPDRLAQAITKVYRISVGRTPVAEEIGIWKHNFATGLPFYEFLLGMAASPEAQQTAEKTALLPAASDGEFVQAAYELVLGRGAAAWEIESWRGRLAKGEVSRVEMLVRLFADAEAFFRAQELAAPHDGLSCLIMGTGRHLTAAQWKAQAAAMATDPPSRVDARYAHRFHVRGEPRFLVSALASLYRGGDYIEQFMENLTNQDGFEDFCELVIVDADSPEDEYKTIERYLKRFKNINYIRCNYRIGIYDAWNVAAKAARGDYLTNTNLDDMRRHDSFMLQAGVLESLPFVDVVYQDLYYTFDPRLSFGEIAAFGHETTLPVITHHNMIQFNSPHNAPMWRKRLHEELGWFNTNYKSAGDYDFWLRCLEAGKQFYKINDPHVVYYQNPKGLSTRPDSRGVLESMEIHRRYCRRLIPSEVLMSREDFVAALESGDTGRLDSSGTDRYYLAQAALRQLARRAKPDTTYGSVR